MSQQDLHRYTAATHAMQTGVALEMQQRTAPTELKHLRVGVNAAMCDHTALVKILIKKGVLTQDEYEKAIADEMELEVKRYEERNPGVKFV
jgi:hypothetical protein